MPRAKLAPTCALSLSHSRTRCVVGIELAAGDFFQSPRSARAVKILLPRGGIGAKEVRVCILGERGWINSRSIGEIKCAGIRRELAVVSTCLSIYGHVYELLHFYVKWKTI